MVYIENLHKYLFAIFKRNLYPYKDINIIQISLFIDENRIQTYTIYDVTYI